MDTQTSIGFIGAGRVAAALATGLAARGYVVTAVYSRTQASAERLAGMLIPAANETHAGAAGGPVRADRPLVVANPQAVADRCNIVFVTTPDDAIAAVAASVLWRQGQGAVHCSGALSIEALAPVALAGGETAGFHPLQTFARPETSLQGVTIAIEGAGPLVERLKIMAADLGARWIPIPSEGKALYHLAGVLTSNYVVTLVKAATDLLETLGIPEDRGREAVLPLLAATVENIRALGIPGSLTGPVARGDTGTIGRHLEALDRLAPELAEVYRTLGGLTIPIARAKGTVSGTMSGHMRELFNHGRRDPEPIEAWIPKKVEVQK